MAREDPIRAELRGRLVIIRAPLTTPFLIW